MQGKHAFSIVMWVLFLSVIAVNAREAEKIAVASEEEHGTYQGYNYEDRIGEIKSSRVIEVPDDFATIQTAINNASVGDIIQVKPKIYFESIVVNKTVSLIGDDRDTTIIDGTGTVVLVTADNVIISGFTVRNGAIGIWLDSSWNTTVTDNNVNKNDDGIHLFSSQNCLISKNNSSNNHQRGIFLNSSLNCTVSRNIARYNGWYGINLNSSRNCIVDGNEAESNNWDGIGLYLSENCVIHGNNVKNTTWYGTWLDSSNNNIIYHNNFLHNYIQASSVTSSNIWDNNLEGNYWSDYAEQDPTEDGIGETPYTIDENNTDNYPLMGQFSSFDIMGLEKTYCITTVSNCTISNFNLASGQISFYVTGLNETTGFCRISISTALLNSPYNVTVNGGKPLTFEELPISNDTLVYLYFTYPPTTHQIFIVPEFPSVFWLIIVMNSVALVTWRLRVKNCQQTE